MKNLLSNNWFIGITSSVVSTLLYYIIINIIAKFYKKESIYKANNEILTLLKPYVIDIGFPEIDIVLSLIEATSRKYNIQPNQMYSIKILCEELIKEITESIYITSEKKNEYNHQLIKYKKEIEKIEIFTNFEEIEKLDLKDRFVMKILTIFPIILTTMTLLIYMENMEKYQVRKVQEMLPLLPLLLLATVLLLFGIIISLRLFKNLRETIRSSKEKKDNIFFREKNL